MRRGWCPSLSRPMQSGDGLLVRVRPARAALDAAALRALADAAARFGNGIMQITARGAFQLRGLRAATLAAFADAVHTAELRDVGRVVPPPFADDATLARADALDAALARFDLPAKFAVVMPAAPEPGDVTLHPPFGLTDADALRALADRMAAARAAPAPGRALMLRGADAASLAGLPFIADPRDPRLRVHACPGAPACVNARAPTLPLARALAHAGLSGTIHVSGCAKGCALPSPADWTLTATAPGRYDLIRNGRADAPPARRAIAA